VIVLVETLALEGDADLAEDLLHGSSAHFGLAVVGLRAHCERVVGERLPELEHLLGSVASIVVGGHG
jgi:hypothetical protein